MVTTTEPKKFTITIFYGKQQQTFEHCTPPGGDQDHITWFIDASGKRHAMRGNFHAVEE